VKKVLVTGGFGFIGFRLVRHFRDKGLDVIVLEHPDSPIPPGAEDIQVLRADIADEHSLSRVRLAGVDAVLHLAAQSSGPRSFSIPLIDIRLNVVGTLNVINWCLANQVERLVFASSFVVYGDHPDKEVLAEGLPCYPKSVYATSKLAAEHLLMNYAQPKGIRWNALRMFNVYGPGQDITKPDQGVVGIFMNMMTKGDNVQVKGRLDRFRDLIYVEDVIQGWDRCLHGSTYNEMFNLGTGVRTTFDELICSLAAVMGKADRLRIEQLDGTPGDLMGCIADVTKIRAALGYTPRFSLSDGLQRMWAWAAEHRYA
jgi:UDP-glucose 4-epimerase